MLHPGLRRLGNPIGAYFGRLRQLTLANSHHPNHTVQTRALHRYLRWRNAHARWGGRPLVVLRGHTLMP